MNEPIKPRNDIVANAKRLRELHNGMHSDAANHKTGETSDEQWSRISADYFKQYDDLAFPGGLDAGRLKLKSGDPGAIEDALAFLETRPYFFRSQYIRTNLIRILKQLELSNNPLERLQRILEIEHQKKLGRRKAWSARFS